MRPDIQVREPLEAKRLVRVHGPVALYRILHARGDSPVIQASASLVGPAYRGRGYGHAAHPPSSAPPVRRMASGAGRSRCRTFPGRCVGTTAAAAAAASAAAAAALFCVLEHSAHRGRRLVVLLPPLFAFGLVFVPVRIRAGWRRRGLESTVAVVVAVGGGGGPRHWR